eukprot:GHVL01017890.1.p1 GENE.GHVL01017890.1~~GHVL01017890.1.p1  ORF type:complete len:115 (+),score=21.75 GHVL01017890.1:58-402(+)
MENISKAIIKGDIKTFRDLFPGLVNKNQLNKKGFGLLHLAIQNGEETIIDLLLEERDIDVNFLDNSCGWPPIITSVNCMQGNLDVLAKLLKRQADINARDSVKGKSALHWAAGE